MANGELLSTHVISSLSEYGIGPASELDCALYVAAFDWPATKKIKATDAALAMKWFCICMRYP
jgi:hypothetical protein